MIGVGCESEISQVVRSVEDSVEVTLLPIGTEETSLMASLLNNRRPTSVVASLMSIFLPSLYAVAQRTCLDGLEEIATFLSLLLDIVPGMGSNTTCEKCNGGE